MIVDKIEHILAYHSSTTPLKVIEQFLQATDFTQLKEGRIELTPLDFVLVQHYEPFLENNNYEYHKEYIDIHYIVEGNERIRVSSLPTTSSVDSFDKDKDIGFTLCGESCQEITLSKQEFAIIYPWETHAPCIYSTSPTVKKLVFKIHRRYDYA